MGSFPKGILNCLLSPAASGLLLKHQRGFIAGALRCIFIAIIQNANVTKLCESHLFSDLVVRFVVFSGIHDYINNQQPEVRL